MKELERIITDQQKGHKDDDVFMVGEQLKDMVRQDPIGIELLKRDLVMEGMCLKDAAKALRDFADKNHGSSKCFVITPVKAESILREFYGLSDRGSARMPSKSVQSNFLDLESFL